MLDDKPVLYEAPEVPTDWDYDKSVEVMAARMRTWKSLTVEILTELHVAREILSKPHSHGSGWGWLLRGHRHPKDARRTVGCSRALMGTDTEEAEESLMGTVSAMRKR